MEAGEQLLRGECQDPGQDPGLGPGPGPARSTILMFWGFRRNSGSFLRKNRVPPTGKPSPDVPGRPAGFWFRALRAVMAASCSPPLVGGATFLPATGTNALFWLHHPAPEC